MKKAKEKFISALWGISAVGIMLTTIFFAILSIRFATVLIRGLSLTGFIRYFGFTDIFAILLSVASISLVILIYFRIIQDNINILPKKALCAAPAYIQQIFRNHYFSDNRIAKLHSRIIILCDTQNTTLNAYTDKNNNIVITNGFLIAKQSSDRIKAALFHEFGHIVNKDNQKKRCILSFKCLTILICVLCAAFFYIVSICSMLYLTGHVDISLIYKISILNGLIEFVILTLCHFLDITIELFNLYKSRQSEYNADKFAASFGMRMPLIEFLKYTSEYEEARGKKRQSELLDSHPSIIKRIDELEKL